MGHKVFVGFNVQFSYAGAPSQYNSEYAANILELAVYTAPSQTGTILVLVVLTTHYSCSDGARSFLRIFFYLAFISNFPLHSCRFSPRVRQNNCTDKGVRLGVPGGPPIVMGVPLGLGLGLHPRPLPRLAAPGGACGGSMAPRPERRDQPLAVPGVVIPFHLVRRGSRRSLLYPRRSSAPVHCAPPLPAAGATAGPPLPRAREPRLPLLHSVGGAQVPSLGARIPPRGVLGRGCRVRVASPRLLRCFARQDVGLRDGHVAHPLRVVSHAVDQRAGSTRWLARRRSAYRRGG